MEPYIGVNEAAALVGFNPESLRRAAREGRVPSAKIAGVWRFRASDLEALFAPRPVTARRRPAKPPTS